MTEPATNIVAFSRFKVSLFQDVKASDVTEDTFTLETLADLIRNQIAVDKADLPLLKLARFGNIRTPHGSLRHALNMLAVTGCEGDYDAGEIDPKEIVETLRDEGISAIVYTTPSNKALRPRWRVLTPFSREYPASDRNRFLARLNGILGGILALESWTLPQPYYYGATEDTEEMAVHVIDGKPIDTLDHLDAIAAGQTQNREKITGNFSPNTQNGLGLELHSRRKLTEPELKSILSKMPNGPGDQTPWRDRNVWIGIGHAIAGATDHAPWAKEQWIDWSAQFDGDLSEAEDRWNTFREPRAGFTFITRMFNAYHGDGAFAQVMRATEIASSGPLFKSSGDFVKDFVPPEYIMDGVIQRRFSYTLTAQTGHGKTSIALLLALCIATGQPFGAFGVEQGTVAYFAGENPDDVRTRWVALCGRANVDPATISVYFMDRVVDIAEGFEPIRDELARVGKVDLVIIDTAAAYFQGDDENSNTQLKQFAQDCRAFTRLDGGPCVLTLTHPGKNAGKDDLVPRGGGAFLAEIDGNLTAWKSGDMTVEFHYHRKLRGPGFDPITLELEVVTNDRNRDSKGRHIPTVVAKIITQQEHADKDRVAESSENQLLHCIVRNPGKPGKDLATSLGWMRLQKVYEVADRLKGFGFIKKYGRGYDLTPDGKKMAKRLGYVE